MRRSGLLWAIVLSALLGIASCNRASSDERAVTSAFNTYKSALLNKDTPEALNILSQDTLDYYSDMVQLARTATEAELRERMLLEQFIVLRLRIELNPQELASISGPEVLQLAIDSGWIDPKGTAAIKVEGVEMKDDQRADIIFRQYGNKMSGVYLASLENGSWKIDLSRSMQALNPAFEQQARFSGMNWDDFLGQIFISMGHPHGLLPVHWEPTDHLLTAQ